MWRFWAWQCLLAVGWLVCTIYTLYALGLRELDVNTSWFGPKSGLLKTFRGYHFRYLSSVCIALTKLPGAVCGFLAFRNRANLYEAEMNEELRAFRSDASTASASAGGEVSAPKIVQLAAVVPLDEFKQRLQVQFEMHNAFVQDAGARFSRALDAVFIFLLICAITQLQTAYQRLRANLLDQAALFVFVFVVLLCVPIYLVFCMLWISTSFEEHVQSQAQYSRSSAHMEYASTLARFVKLPELFASLPFRIPITRLSLFRIVATLVVPVTAVGAKTFFNFVVAPLDA